MKITILDDYFDTLRHLPSFAKLSDHDVTVAKVFCAVTPTASVTVMTRSSISNLQGLQPSVFICAVRRSVNAPPDISCVAVHVPSGTEAPKVEHAVLLPVAQALDPVVQYEVSLKVKG